MSTKVLRPIEYRDAYLEAVQPHVMGYFDEVLFGPLLAILRDERVPERGMKKAEGPRSRYDNAAEEGWEAFPVELPSLGVPRRMMPQIASEARHSVIRHLAGLGVGIERAEVDPRALRPTQAEWSRDKVEAARKRLENRPILISGENRVVDGHHQWLAALFDGQTAIPAVRFLAPTRSVLDLIATSPRVERENAGGTALELALESGRVWFADGVFSGHFTAAISRQLTEMGASFDAGGHVFRLAAENLPADVRIAAVASLDRSRSAHERVMAFIDEAQINAARAATGIYVDVAVRRISEDLQAQFVETVKGLDWITVQPEVDPAMRKALTEELTENLDLDVKRFLAEEIPEMRRMVEQNVFDGMRGDKLADIITGRYGVAKRKAAFLAFQETSLLVSNYREQQAKAIGSLSYVWSTSKDRRVRHDHEELQGRTFLWDDPPVTNERTGARNNPGEDYGCRCTARPVITVPGSFEVVNSRGAPTVSRCTTPRRPLIGSPT